MLIQRGSDMDRQDQIRKELIEKKLQAGIIKLSNRFDFDMDSIQVDHVFGVIEIKNDPVYMRLLSRCHGGWDAKPYAYLQLRAKSGKLERVKL